MARNCKATGHSVVHEDLSENLRTVFQTAMGILATEDQRAFHQLQALLSAESRS